MLRNSRCLPSSQGQFLNHQVCRYCVSWHDHLDTFDPKLKNALSHHTLLISRKQHLFLDQEPKINVSHGQMKAETLFRRQAFFKLPWRLARTLLFLIKAITTKIVPANLQGNSKKACRRNLNLTLYSNVIG